MGISTWYFKQQTIDFILRNYSTTAAILDVGAGAGTYADLLRQRGYTNMDCVEAWLPYIEKFALSTKYNQVFYGDVTTLELDFSRYQLVILGDVFEHISKEAAARLLDRLKPADVLVAIPFESDQGALNGNPYEMHRQNTLTPFDFVKDYPAFNTLCLRYDYGVFINKPVSPVYIEDKENELPASFYKFVLQQCGSGVIEFV